MLISRLYRLKPKMLTLLLASAFIGNLIDTIATVYLYTNGLGYEANPISAWLLQSIPAFVIVKIGVMAIAVLCIWLKRNMLIFKISAWILGIEYFLVALYYAALFVFVY